MTGILIVENDRKRGSLLKAIFRSAGFEATLVSGFGVGLAQVSVSRPSLIVAASVPDCDSVCDFCRAIKSAIPYYGLPVLVVGSRITDTERTQLVRAGADDCLSDPLGDSLLLARVKSLLRLSGADASCASHRTGLAEAGGSRPTQRRVALYCPDRNHAADLATALQNGLQSRVAVIAGDVDPTAEQPADVIVLDARLDSSLRRSLMQTLRLIRTDEGGARPGVVILLEPPDREIATSAYDMGVDLAILGLTDPDALCHQIDRVLARVSAGRSDPPASTASTRSHFVHRDRAAV